jgi:hypothetical protein
MIIEQAPIMKTNKTNARSTKTPVILKIHIFKSAKAADFADKNWNVPYQNWSFGQHQSLQHPAAFSHNKVTVLLGWSLAMYTQRMKPDWTSKLVNIRWVLELVSFGCLQERNGGWVRRKTPVNLCGVLFVSERVFLDLKKMKIVSFLRESTERFGAGYLNLVNWPIN